MFFLITNEKFSNQTMRICITIEPMVSRSRQWSRVLAQLAQQSLSESLPIKTRSRQWIGGVEILI